MKKVYCWDCRHKKIKWPWMKTHRCKEAPYASHPVNQFFKKDNCLVLNKNNDCKNHEKKISYI